MAFFRNVDRFSRLLRANPLWAASIVLNLSLAAGLTTAVYSILDAVLLRPFPFTSPERLVVSWASPTIDAKKAISWEDLNRLRTETAIFEDGAPFLPEAPLRFEDSGREITCSYVDSKVFGILGTAAAQGRVLSNQDETADVVVISHRLWSELLGRDPAAVGRTLHIGGTSRTIIGIMPATFFFPDFNVFAWLPLSKSSMSVSLDAPAVYGLFRLQPGVAASRARYAMNEVVANGRPASGLPQFGLFFLQDLVVGDYKRSLALLLGAVVMTWLIAVANATVLLLAKGLERQKEFAIRLALGATRRDLLLQTFGELAGLIILSLILAVTIANGTLAGIHLLSANEIPRLEYASLNGSTLLVALVLVIGGGFSAGIWPAFHATRQSPAGALQLPTNVGQPSRRHKSFQNVFVVAQLAVATALCVVAGLLLNGFVSVARADWGITPKDAGLIQTQFDIKIRRDPASHVSTIEQSLAALAKVPGVQSVGMGYSVPGKWGTWSPRILRVAGHTDERILGGVYQVSRGYFKSLGIPLQRGREFDDGDTASSTPVVVMSEALALALFGREDPIGKDVQILEAVGDISNLRVVGNITWKVIGVVRNVRMFGLDVVTRPSIYVEYRQEPSTVFAGISKPRFVVRSEPGDLKSVLPSAVTAIRGVSSDIAFSDVAPMESVLGRSLAGVAGTKLMAATFTTLGGLAALLSGIGLYGLMLQMVARSRYDLAIRSALGATAMHLGSIILGRALKMCLVSLAFGLALSLGLSRIVKSLLPEMSRINPLAYVAAVAIAIVITTLATLVPALRASQVQPNAIRRL